MKTLKRRRQQGKTDYSKRINLLKSGSARIVFRRTSRYILAQYVSSKEAQDKVEIGLTSVALMKHGWPKEARGSLKSLPAAYLTGLLLGKKILNEKKNAEKNAPVVDIGMTRAIHKNRFFAFLKGLKDSGISVKIKKEEEKFFPAEERIQGKHLKKDFSGHFQKIKSSIEKS